MNEEEKQSLQQSKAREERLEARARSLKSTEDQSTPEDITATLVDINLEEKDSGEDRSDSPNSLGSGNSTGSEKEIFSSRGDKKKAGLIIPNISFSYIPSTNETEAKCIVKFDRTRPQTTEKAQNNHKLSYAMLVDVMVGRLDGREVEDAIDLMQELVSEYVAQGDALNKYKDLVKLKKSELGNVLSKDDRKRIYRIDKDEAPSNAQEALRNSQETRRLIEDSTAIDQETKNAIIASLDLSQQANERLLMGIEERNSIATPLEIRNEVKKSAAISHKEALRDVLKGGITVLSKIEALTFVEIDRGYSKEQKRTNMSSQGGIIADRLSALRGEKNKDYEIEEVATLIVETFDYPADDIVKNALKAGKESDLHEDEVISHIKEEFFKNVALLEKASYDAYEMVRDFSDTQRERFKALILDNILNRSSEPYPNGAVKIVSSWEDFFTKQNLGVFDIQREYQEYSNVQSIDGEGRVILKNKFTARVPNTLSEEVALLEEKREKADLNQQTIQKSGKGGSYR